MSTQQKQQSFFSLENLSFYLSLILLVASVGAYFYLNYLIEQDNIRLADLSMDLAKAKTEEQKELEEKILLTQQKLKDFGEAMDTHVTATNFFKEFEASVLPEVYFSDANINPALYEVELSGFAKNFESLGQQIALMKGRSDVFQSVKLEKAAIDDEGGVGFGFMVKLNPAVISNVKATN